MKSTCGCGCGSSSAFTRACPRQIFTEQLPGIWLVSPRQWPADMVPEPIEGVLAHELGHYVGDRLAARGPGRCPAWFNEGVATFLAGQANGRDLGAWRRLLRATPEGQLFSLAAGREPYLLGYHVLPHLVEARGGWANVRTLLHTLDAAADPPTFAAAFAQVCDYSVS
jgi:hypothetical protein